MNAVNPATEKIIDSAAASTTITPTVGAEPAATVAARGESAFFTEGEMLPWKNRWFRVHLITQDGQKYIQLEMLKPTAASSKRLARAERWNEQHPRAVTRRDGRPLSPILKSHRFGGPQSGSPVSAPV